MIISRKKLKICLAASAGGHLTQLLKIVDNCKEAKEDKIIITHGTDTMVKTAKVLGNTIKKKTIVLTGAMIPYKFGSSDGLFNLGCAIAFVQTLPHGLYVAMNGRYFKSFNVKKNKLTGEFEKIKKHI